MTRMEARNVLMALVVVGFFAVFGLLLFFPVPEQNRDLIQMLGMPLSGVFGFLVGWKPAEKKE